MVEVDGVRAGSMGFEVENRRSRVAALGGLAILPSFRGRRLADDAARVLQRHLFRDLGYHRLQLEIYAFNERAIAHAERAGFVREGARRRAYWRHGAWVDGVLFGLVRDDVDEPRSGIEVLFEHVVRFNDGVRTGDWAPMLEQFAAGARMSFEGVPVGPFIGRDAIAAAYRDQPPDDEIEVLDAEERGDGLVVARYAWAAEPRLTAGEMRLRYDGDEIVELVVTFTGGWHEHPDAVGDHAHRPPVEPGGRVVGLGAICDLRPQRSEEARSQSFSVSEFVTLEDGRRVILHEDRGFTIDWRSSSESHESPESMTRNVLNVVLPDDDDESADEHPWSWLADLARARGLDVAAEDLRALPYEVIFTNEVRRWLRVAGGA